MEPVYLSISDINDFLRCRRRWDYSSVNRQGLRHKASPSLAVSVGSAVHVGVDVLASTGKTSLALAATQDYLDKDRAERIAAYKDEYGVNPLGSDLRKFDEGADLAIGMVEQYARQYGSFPFSDESLTHVASEVTFKIPLPVENREVYFVGTWDSIAVDFGTNTAFLVERKTFSRTPNRKDLQHLPQLVGYAWAFQVVTGESVGGVLYDGLAKRLITKPRVLKDGSLSTDKRASVTLQGFLDAMQEIGTDPFDEKHGPRYTEYIEFLEERERFEDNRFFLREMLTFTQDQLEAFGVNLSRIAHEMVNDPIIYPTFTRDGCMDCWIKDLCYPDEKGFGVEDVIRTRYEQKTYGTMDTIRAIEPSEITSLDDLIAAVKETDGTSNEDK